MSNDVTAIDSILILDDNPRVREDYTFPIEAAGRKAIPVDGKLGSLESFLARDLHAEAAVSDYQLSPGNYASFDGATLVSAWYRQRFPAILCTTFDKSNVAQFRALRRWIPIIMPPTDLDPDSLMQGLELVQRELQDEFVPARRPWRALVRFVEFDEEINTANARLPGWSDEVVAFRASDLPEFIRESAGTAAKAGDEYRCFAIANLGSESNDELYVSEWEETRA